MNKYYGLPGAGGTALGRVNIIKKAEVVLEDKKITDPLKELKRLETARTDYREELGRLYEETKISLGGNEADIFKAYQVILGDDIFFNKAIERVKKEKTSIEYAIEQEKIAVCTLFASMKDEYMKERSTDIENVCNELIKRLTGGSLQSLERNMSEDFIVLAKELTPEDTIKMDKTFLKGFVTEKGGVTSHSVILAKSLGIPAIVGVKGILNGVMESDEVFMNGSTGEIILDPDSQVKESYKIERKKQQEILNRYQQEQELKAVTLDGHSIDICVNAGDTESLKTINTKNCDGIGLLRTEFIYMDQNDYPGEDDQFEIYKDAVQKAGGKNVVIRTLDIGGDKHLAYMDLPKEENPFLGYRAIRICLDRRDIFLTQLRAILRASSYGNVSIMFPMIATLEELLEAKKIVNKAMEQLREEKQPFDEEIKIGIMIETPAAVILSDHLAKEADFFSIGTNDLIQYMTATDRMNEKVQYLYDSCNLSVLRSVDKVVQNGHKAGILVSICGEAASEERLLPLWIAMGVDKLSVVPSKVGQVKYRVRHMDKSNCDILMEELMQMNQINSIKERLEGIEYI